MLLTTLAWPDWHFQQFSRLDFKRSRTPVATDTPPLATDTPPLVEGSPSSVCNVNIPQDQVLDVRDTPSGDNVVSTLENGTDVAIVDQQQTWVLIKLIDPNNPAGLFVPNNPDNLGWVLQDYIQCGSDPQ